LPDPAIFVTERNPHRKSIAQMRYIQLCWN